MSESFLTIEEVAAKYDMTVAQIYESRRRKEFPGALGHRRGKRVLWVLSELDTWGKDGTINDPNVAMVRTLSAIEKLLAKQNAQISTAVVYLQRAVELFEETRPKEQEGMPEDPAEWLAGLADE
jgi:predicted DNA-binding transcriptional regulator AlpA